MGRAAVTGQLRISSGTNPGKLTPESPRRHLKTSSGISLGLRKPAAHPLSRVGRFRPSRPIDRSHDCYTHSARRIFPHRYALGHEPGANLRMPLRSNPASHSQPSQQRSALRLPRPGSSRRAPGEGLEAPELPQAQRTRHRDAPRELDDLLVAGAPVRGVETQLGLPPRLRSRGTAFRSRRGKMPPTKKQPGCV
jgi:hypothetical protein